MGYIFATLKIIAGVYPLVEENIINLNNFYLNNNWDI